MRYVAYALLVLGGFFAVKAGGALTLAAGALASGPAATLAVALPLTEAVLLAGMAVVMIERAAVEAQRAFWHREIELERQARARGLRRELLEAPALSKNTF
jgi:hypothetical protein